MKSILLLIIAFSFSQISARTITGTVIDESGLSLPGVNILVKGTNTSAQTDIDGKFSIEASKGDILTFSFIGFITEKIKIKDQTILEVVLKESRESLDEVILLQNDAERSLSGVVSGISYANPPENTESYKPIEENIFKRVGNAPLSTFSIDVDRAGYSNIRRMINNGQDIPVDAVKIEEMINYFNYDYSQPTGNDPFSINTEVAATPWNDQTQLVKIGLQGKIIPLDDVPASNLVFLIDVSGSMNSPNKLELLKSAFKLLTDNLREQDKVAMVVYAGAAGVVLEPTSGNEKAKIKEALQKLQAGGSTAGGEGIKMAYKIAEEHFIEGGNNRVILATDGDFNVGASSDRAMEDLIEEKRNSGVFLTCLGFGMGNYKDSKMETLADKGNGNYAYIDNMQEAKRVLGTEFGGTIYTIAKDVKIQVEFNPGKVAAYRLIGYENRLLNDEDFNDDQKDAGELGSGHTVTALYEIIPVGVKSKFLKEVDDLKYSRMKNKDFGEELLTVKFRYKEPDGNNSKLITKTVNSPETEKEPSEDLKFMSAVALFGMNLRESEYSNNCGNDVVIDLAEAGRGADGDGYRAEFIRLVKTYE
ncbi:vWA domain-containing protein [Christiangramia flava]|uniref:von Willebrand factor type A domain protein n=1 Tax=Christiangramia flava JLT2011 TaxID=1229726 RepID=A0A1L7I0B4_9FLAO|nr:VWA domain-containing protein [Christiangramia flava]APU67036.1 Von Willebrand factor type A domain protein [Christiangramia flava JLT2011]OSS38709.1 Von Willebrand factor type A domain protein [Christiangramia flava JLT2011]